MISIAVSLHWPLFQLDVKNTFLNGELQEVYMEWTLGYVAQGYVDCERPFMDWNSLLVCCLTSLVKLCCNIGSKGPHQITRYLFIDNKLVLFILLYMYMILLSLGLIMMVLLIHSVTSGWPSRLRTLDNFVIFLGMKAGTLLAPTEISDGFVRRIWYGWMQANWLSYGS